jgi:hypothetical protein
MTLSRLSNRRITRLISILVLIGLLLSSSSSGSAQIRGQDRETPLIGEATRLTNRSDKPVTLVVATNTGFQLRTVLPNFWNYPLSDDVEAIWAQCAQSEFRCRNINGRWQRVYKLGGLGIWPAVFTTYTEQGGSSNRVILSGRSLCEPWDPCGWLASTPNGWPTPQGDLPYTLESCAKHTPKPANPGHIEPCPEEQPPVWGWEDGATFVRHVTLPNDSTVMPGQSYVKTWELRNSGRNVWNSNYRLVFRSGDRLGAPTEVTVPAASPNQRVNVSVQLNIPSNLGPGTYTGYWQMRNSQGTYFGDQISYRLRVGDSQPPGGNGVDVSLVSVSDIPESLSPGQIFRPSITVHVDQGQLICCTSTRGDMLLPYFSHNYSDFPHISVDGTVNTGQNFTFRAYADNPWVAPQDPGTYTSEWRVWANGGWVGPIIPISFSVYGQNSNHPPNAPSLDSPYNWQQFLGTTPTLCGHANGDPDDNPIEKYQFEIFGSLQQWESDWQTSSCVTPPNLQYTVHPWHMRVMDSRGGISDYSETWHFTIEDTSITINQLYTEPASPSNADTVVIRACTTGNGGQGITMRTSINTATDGSPNGEWRIIHELGVPCFNSTDAPRWDTLEYQEGTHLIRVQAWTNQSNTTRTMPFTLLRGKPSRPFLQFPSHEFWSNTRTVTLSWSPSMRVNSYRLIVGTTQDPTQSPIFDVPLSSTTTSYTYTFAQDYPRLYWRVYAINEVGETGQDGRWFGIDRTAPVSSITGTASLSYDPQFPVAWSGSDGDSGVQTYDVQVKQEPNGTWTDWLRAYPNTSAIFSGQPGNTYSFRSRANDIAGNTEAYPVQPDAQVEVDPTQRPAEAWWDVSYRGKRTVVIVNPLSSVILPAGYTAHLHFDSSTSPTAAEIYDASISPIKGGDVRVVYDNQTQLARHMRNFTSSEIDIYFATQAPIDPSASSTSYQIYYGNDSPGKPPTNLGDVYVPGVDANTRAAWFYEDAQGTADSSGNNHNITWQNPGTVSMDYGLHGQGVRLTGNPDGRAMAGIPVGDYLTAETWIYFEGPALPPLMYTELLNKRNPENNADRWGIRIQSCGSNNTPCIRGSIEVLNPNPTAFGLDWNGVVQPDVWYHLAITYDGNVGRMWVNGQNVDTRSAPNGRVRDDGQPIRIGRIQDANQVNWRMDGTRISNSGRPLFDYGKVTTQPSTGVGVEITQEQMGQADLALDGLTTYLDAEGNLVAQAILSNRGLFPTVNEFRIHAYKDYVPTGPGDLTNAISFWVNQPISPNTSITLTTVLTPSQLLGASRPLVPANDTYFSLAGQVDSTGVVSDAVRANNIISGTQACITTPDGFEGDDTYASARDIAVGEIQTHNSHLANDADWVKFQAQAGNTYIIHTTNLGVGADTHLYLYDTTGTNLLASNDDISRATLASEIQWTAPASGTYYILAKQWNPITGGCATYYDLAVTNCPQDFTDVLPGSTFYDFVRCISCRAIVGGYADGSFRPSNNITRGQLSKIISNAAGFGNTPTGQRFEDVPPGSTFYDYVSRLASLGIVGGYECGGPGEPCVGPENRPYFRPGSNATRGQISKIVSNAAGFTETPTSQTFEDVPPGSTFYTWIQQIAGLGIVGGYECGGPGEPCVGPENRPYFRPGNNATRGQLTKIVSNTFFPNCAMP